MSLVKWIDFQCHGDDRGQLGVLESNLSTPFDIRRVYYLFGTKADVPRGFHAHKQLEQAAVCIAGRCRMILDDGEKKEEVWLDRPDKCVRIEKMIWHEMHDFSKDCVMLVLASEHYDESDYIRDYQDFLQQVSA